MLSRCRGAAEVQGVLQRCCRGAVEVRRHGKDGAEEVVQRCRYRGAGARCRGSCTEVVCEHWWCIGTAEQVQSKVQRIMYRGAEVHPEVQKCIGAEVQRKVQRYRGAELQS